MCFLKFSTFCEVLRSQTKTLTFLAIMQLQKDSHCKRHNSSAESSYGYTLFWTEPTSSWLKITLLRKPFPSFHPESALLMWNLLLNQLIHRKVICNHKN